MAKIDYSKVMKQLPRPTEEQTNQFAEFVSDAHSWYKHLPVYPGSPFYFYLDPNAGRSMVHLPTGGVTFVDITEESRPLHDTWQPTQTYRNRFGFWDYYASYGTFFLFCEKEGVVDTRGSVGVDKADKKSRRRTGPVILAPEVGWLEVPDTLLDAGEVLLTSLVHPHRNFLAYWAPLPGGETEIVSFPDLCEKHFGCFPEEVARGISLLNALWGDKAYSNWLGFVYESYEGDTEECRDIVYNILLPAMNRERERQLAAIKAAMNRFLAAVWDTPG